jgi:hypothetical protein
MSLKQDVGELLIQAHSQVSELTTPIKKKLDKLLEEQPSLHHNDIKQAFTKKINSEVATFTHTKLSDRYSYEDVLDLIQQIKMPVALGYFSEREFDEGGYKV